MSMHDRAKIKPARLKQEFSHHAQRFQFFGLTV